MKYHPIYGRLMTTEETVEEVKKAVNENQIKEWRSKNPNSPWLGEAIVISVIRDLLKELEAQDAGKNVKSA